MQRRESDIKKQIGEEKIIKFAQASIGQGNVLSKQKEEFLKGLETLNTKEQALSNHKQSRINLKEILGFSKEIVILNGFLDHDVKRFFEILEKIINNDNKYNKLLKHLIHKYKKYQEIVINFNNINSADQPLKDDNVTNDYKEINDPFSRVLGYLRLLTNKLKQYEETKLVSSETNASLSTSLSQSQFAFIATKDNFNEKIVEVFNFLKDKLGFFCYLFDPSNYQAIEWVNKNKLLSKGFFEELEVFFDSFYYRGKFRYALLGNIEGTRPSPGLKDHNDEPMWSFLNNSDYLLTPQEHQHFIELLHQNRNNPAINKWCKEHNETDLNFHSLKHNKL